MASRNGSAMVVPGPLPDCVRRGSDFFRITPPRNLYYPSQRFRAVCYVEGIATNEAGVTQW